MKRRWIDPDWDDRYSYHRAIAQILTEEGLPSRAYPRDLQHQENIVIKLVRPKPRKHRVYTACLDDHHLLVGTSSLYILKVFDIRDPKIFEQLVEFIKTAPEDTHDAMRHQGLELGDMLENWIINSDNFGPLKDGAGPYKAFSEGEAT